MSLSEIGKLNAQRNNVTLAKTRQICGSGKMFGISEFAAVYQQLRQPPFGCFIYCHFCAGSAKEMKK